MKTIKLGTAIKRLRKLNNEIRYRDFFSAETFTSGVIAFSAARGTKPKEIEHHDKDVICQVIKGRGRLRSAGRRLALTPGMVCHIPKATPHDFAATRGELVLFYALIRTR
jgi:mannose-6-phosphate isomerase-like protein (cupin superfamily)